MHNNQQNDDYHTIARYYDPLLTLPMRSIRKHVLKVVRQFQPRNILDIACGTGQQLRMLGHTESELYGIDSSLAMIDVAKSKNHFDIRFNCGDATNMPFKDKNFDLCIISMALHEMASDLRQGILAESKRVLNQCGSLLIVDYCLPVNWFHKLASRLVTFVEKNTEGDHYKNYCQWMGSGAIESFLEQNQLVVHKTRRFLWGNAKACLCTFI